MGPGFLERALLEAARYGSDPWVFVRELLQNARDASATRAVWTCDESTGVARLSCRDDGEGMSFSHAQRFLFTLYASSKEGRKGEAGRFGVGFWSVLRFGPKRIVIRSWPKDGEPWEITLDGRLTRAVRGEPPSAGSLGCGTEIVLERADPDGQLERRVRDAAWQSARFLTRKGSSVPLTVTVNGRAINAAFELPPPSASFRRGDAVGVVGLGKSSRVELFSRGLRVRSATALEDLVSTSAPSAASTRVRFPELAEGLAPQAILSNDELELLLSRSDAREDRRLKRLVRLAQRELERLVERQLAFSRPERWWRRIGERIATAPRGLVALLALETAVLVGGAGWMGRAWLARPAVQLADAPSAAEPAPAAFHDPGALYQGPAVDVLDDKPVPLDALYDPPDPIHLDALVVRDLDDAGRATTGRFTDAPYRGVRCQPARCTTIRLPVDGKGPMRVPVPSGEALDPSSLSLDGAKDRLDVRTTTENEPWIDLRGAHTLVYLTGLAAPGAPPPEPRHPLPSGLSGALRAWRELPAESRVQTIADWVRESVRYSTSADDAAREREAIAHGSGFVERTLDLGAGDCDVQNGLLMLVLRESGIPARLVVGYVGEGGRLAPRLHAWVEYRAGSSGRWGVVDASEGAPVPTSAPAVAGAARNGGRPGAPATEGAVSVASAPEPATGARLPAAPLGLVGIALGALATGLLIGRRTRRSIRLDQHHDLARLLAGALSRPAAFAHIPSLFERRLVPKRGGGALSLLQAQEHASAGRLFSAEGDPELAKRALRAGCTVLDRRRPEGRVVAEALGASDLDHWNALLVSSRTVPVVDAVNRKLRLAGERWTVRVVAELPQSPALLEIPGGSGWLLLDARDRRLSDAIALAAASPARAAFTLVDALCSAVRLPEARRSRLLAKLAAEALAERAKQARRRA